MMLIPTADNQQHDNEMVGTQQDFEITDIQEI